MQERVDNCADNVLTCESDAYDIHDCQRLAVTGWLHEHLVPISVYVVVIIVVICCLVLASSGVDTLICAQCSECQSDGNPNNRGVSGGINNASQKETKCLDICCWSRARMD